MTEKPPLLYRVLAELADQPEHQDELFKSLSLLMPKEMKQQEKVGLVELHHLMKHEISGVSKDAIFDKTNLEAILQKIESSVLVESRKLTSFQPQVLFGPKEQGVLEKVTSLRASKPKGLNLLSLSTQYIEKTELLSGDSLEPNEQKEIIEQIEELKLELSPWLKEDTFEREDWSKKLQSHTSNFNKAFEVLSSDTWLALDVLAHQEPELLNTIEWKALSQRSLKHEFNQFINAEMLSDFIKRELNLKEFNKYWEQHPKEKDKIIDGTPVEVESKALHKETAKDVVTVAAEMVVEDEVAEIDLESVAYQLAEEVQPIQKEFDLVDPKPIQKIKRKPIVKEPGIWAETIWPFLSQNLVMVLATGSIFTGLLILLISFWDEATWIRYGLAPLTMVGSSWSLSQAAKWLQKQDIKSQIPIAILECFSIFLAPLSLLMVAFLFSDDQLSYVLKLFWGIGLSSLLLMAWRKLFYESSNRIVASIARKHSHVLLMINALLLLLPVVNSLQLSPEGELSLWSKGLLVAGFYAAFLLISVNLKKVFFNHFDIKSLTEKTVPLFYCMTCIGTYLLVWVLTHARLGHLPELTTYSSLITLSSIIFLMIEARLKKDSIIQTEVKSYSYLAFFMMSLGLWMSLSAPYLRTLNLGLAGLICLLQAKKVADHKQQHLGLILCTLSVLSVALFPGFRAELFPWLVLSVHFSLRAIARHIDDDEFKIKSEKQSWMMLLLMVIPTIAWQWSAEGMAWPWGLALFLQATTLMHLAKKHDSLALVHIAVAFAIIALPYLGFTQIQHHDFSGHFMVLGLSLLCIAWFGLVAYSPSPCLKNSRSSVLWSISVMALSLMLLRVIKPDTNEHSSEFVQLCILSGPILMSGLLFVMAYTSQSYLPVYNGLLVLILIFPEIKDTFGIQMKSGLGSSCSALGFIALAFYLKKREWLNKERCADLILGQKNFPFIAKGHDLFTKPLLIGAGFLLARLCLWLYPQKMLFAHAELELKTTLAITLAGFSMLALGQWSKKIAFSSVAYVLMVLGPMHTFVISKIDMDYFLTFLCFNFILIDLLVLGLSKVSKVDSNVLLPWKKVSVHLPVLISLILPYFVLNFKFEFQDIAFILFYGVWQCVKDIRRQPTYYSFVTLFFLLWEGAVSACCELVFQNQHPYFYQTVISSSLIYFGLLSMGLIFLELKKKATSFYYVSSLAPLLVFFSTLIQLSYFFLGFRGVEFRSEFFVLNGLILLITSRCIAFLPTTVLAVFSILMSTVISSWQEIFFWPETYLAFALCSGVLCLVYRKITWVERPVMKPWFAFAKDIQDHVAWAMLALVASVCVFGRSIEGLRPLAIHDHALMCWGLLVSSALSAKSLGIRKQTYLLMVAGACAWLTSEMFLMDYQDVLGIKTTHIAASGFILTVLLFSLIEKRFHCSDFWYQNLKTFFVILSLSLLILTYFSERSIEGLSNARFLISACLSAAMAMYFRYFVENKRKKQLYGFYVASAVMAMICSCFWIMRSIFSIDLGPESSFHAMSLAPLWFSLRMERNFKRDRIFEPSRNAAFALLFLMSGFYFYQPLFQWVMFPDLSFDLIRYSELAPVSFLVGLALVRTKALKGDALGLYLGAPLAVITFFLSLTLFDKFSLTGKSIHALFLGLAITLIVFYFSRPQQVIFRWLKRWAQHSQREHIVVLRILDITLMLGCHFLFFYVISINFSSAKLVSMFAGMAALWAMMGFLRRHVVYLYVCYAWSLGACLIMDVGLPSVVLLHVLLFCIEEFLLFRAFKGKEKHFQILMFFNSIIVLNVCFIGNYENWVNYSVLGFLWVGLVMMPLSNRHQQNRFIRFFGALAIYLPAIAMFTQLGYDRPRSSLIFLISLSSITLWLQFFAKEHIKMLILSEQSRLRLLNAAIDFVRGDHARLFHVIQLLITIGCLVSHTPNTWFEINQHAFLTFVLHSLVLLYWIKSLFLEQKPYKMIIIQVMGLSFLIHLKFVLMHHFNLNWSATHDLYAATSFSLLSVVLKPILKRCGVISQAPIKYSLYALPILSLSYGFHYDVELSHLAHVLLIHSIVLSWKGVDEKDRLSLSYSFLGYNAYLLMMLFHQKIDSLQVYLIPSSITTLVLLQVFRDKSSQLTANIVRSLCLSVLLGYSLFETLSTELHNPLYHLLILVLCSLTLAAAYFMRVKVFALCATACFFIDLMAISYITLKNQDHDIMRIVLGLCLTLGGGGVLFSYLMVRKYRHEIETLKLKFSKHWVKWD